jgi:phage gp29-like protein
MKSEIKNQKSTIKNKAPIVSRPISARRIQRLKSASSLTAGSLEQTNPLRGLTLSRAVALMESTLRGEYAIPQWTLWHIEQTDPDLFALESRRSSALMEMDWVIKIADLKPKISGLPKSGRATEPQRSEPQSGLTSDPLNSGALAAEQAHALLEAYNKIDNLNEAIEDMSLAFVHGYSIAQFEFESDSDPSSALRPPSSGPSHLGLYDPWNIVRQNLNGDFYFNPEGRSVSWRTLSEQNKIDPTNHLIYTPRKNLMRIALYKFIRQNLSQKDWDAFIEIYGLPSVYIILPPNVTEADAAQYEAAAVEAAEGGSGALPNGSDVKFANEARGVNPFRDHLKYLQEQLILAGTGGLLTMLAMPTGIGSGASDTHDDTFKTIARGEAKKISEVFQKQFDKRILEAAFPGKPPLAYFEIAAKEEQDVGEVIKHALELSQAGYAMDPAELSEKTGYKISISQPVQAGAGPSAPSNPPTPDRPPELPGARTPAPATLLNSDAPPAMAGPRSTLHASRAADSLAIGRLLAVARMDLAAAQDKVLQPLRAELERILATPDSDLQTEILNLKSKLPDLLRQINADPETVKIFEDTMSAALLTGLTEGTTK